MKLLDDLAAFLEQKLDEFLAANPGLKLQILLLEIEQQEAETTHLLQSLHSQKQRAEQEILGLVDEMRRWTERIQKAEAAHRPDLAQAAREKEQSLRQQGNFLWQQMVESQRQIPATQALLAKIKARHQEVQLKLQQSPRPETTARASQTTTQPSPYSTYQPPLSSPSDPLENTFRELELKEALEELKRSLQR